ncbi:ABC transporter permease [bacterium]|nr:ABC transporter permease [bacterium]
MESLWRNLKHGLRILRKKRGATLVMILSLAFGIGAATAIFSIVQGILLNPLPYHKPAELINVWESNPSQGMDQFSASPLNYLDWKKHNQVFENMAAYESSSLTLTGIGEPERLSGAEIRSELIPLLGVPLVLGRNFTEEEMVPGKSNVAILSFGLWKRRFGGDPDILGRLIRIDGQEHKVVGVLPQTFSFPSEQTEILLPFAFDERALSNRGAKWLGVIARLRPGVNLGQAQENMNVVARNLEVAYPDKNKGWGVLLGKLEESVVEEVRKPVLILFAAVCVVLFIACANVAGLLLAGNATRRQEMAIRAALGAKRRHLLSQLLTESVLLGLIGGFLGLLLAVWTKDSLLYWAEKFLPRVSEIAINTQVLGFAFIVSVASGIFFGLLPALLITRPESAIRSQSRGFTQGGARNTFVIAEVALAIVLLSGAGLLIRSLHSLVDVSPGFNPQNVLRFTIQNPESRYPERAQVGVFHLALLERLKNVPGIKDAAAASLLPLTGEDWSFSIDIKGRELPEGDQPSVEYRVVSAGYFRTMKIPIREGRSFTEQDRPNTQPVSVVNEAFARRFFPDQNPIGQEVRIGDTVREFRQIVGVSGNVKDFGLGSDSIPVIYVALSQRPLRYMNYVLRTADDPEKIASIVRQVVHSMDRDMPVFELGTMDHVLSDSISRRKFITYLLAFFAVTALSLALLGLYGLLSYSVSSRTQEIGVRMAMGAEKIHVLRLILDSGVRLVSAGILLGLAGALVATRVLSNMLFEITPTDPVTLAAVAFLLMTVALLAMFFPAKRAANVDPLEALRYE